MFPWQKKTKTYEEKLTEEDIKKNLQSLEKGDIPAIILAALITFLPPILFCLGILYGVLYLLFLRH